MNPTQERTQETSLDPQNWQEFRQLSHRMVDDMLDSLEGVAARPAWKPMPEATRAVFAEAAPKEALGAEATYEEVLRHVLPYPNGNFHPRFWGWVQGTGIPLAMMADMLAAGINPNVAGFDQSPVMVEKQVIRWMAEVMGLPAESSGLLVSGGSMANFIGMAVARHAKAGFDVREQGLHGAKQLVMYCSEEAHSSVQRAAELLGIGNAWLRRIAVNDDFEMNVAALDEAIRQDRAAGLQPTCVIANAGTVNTGALDDLSTIAKVCRKHDLWLHVDGAFGALARLSARLASRVEGIQQADSIAFDLHKWMYLPFECGCVLVRDSETHREAFAVGASYLKSESRGVVAGGLHFADRGIELTRGFKALKAWMCIKAFGLEAFARHIEQNVDQAQYLARLVTEHPRLELLAPVALNIVCFRYVSGHDEERTNALNREILLRLQEEGVAVPSGTTVRGTFAIRCAITNHRSRRADFDALVAAVERIGAEIARA